MILRPGLPNPRKAYLQSILALQIGPASGTAGIDDTLEIASIEHKPSPRSPAPILVSLLGLLAGSALLFLPRRKLAATSPQASILPEQSVPALTAPRPLEAPPPDLERLNRFLADHYSREDLDLATVAAELGMPVRRVTTLLNAHGESFKATLNRLRLQEARRLLLETDLQVSETAFKVGYGNVSHFNRMFRERFETAPGAVRAALRNPPDPAQNLPNGEKNKDSQETA